MVKERIWIQSNGGLKKDVDTLLGMYTITHDGTQFQVHSKIKNIRKSLYPDLPTEPDPEKNQIFSDPKIFPNPKILNQFQSYFPWPKIISKVKIWVNW